MKKVTIHDVARRSGVSLATVSKVLNRYRHVSEETRRKVLGAVNDLKYVPDGQARSIPPDARLENPFTKGTIGFLVSDKPGLSFSDTIVGDILKGVFNETRGRGIHFITDYFKGEHAGVSDLPPMIQNSLVDGVLISTTVNELFLRDLSERGVPFVLVESSYQGREYNSIVSDNFGGGLAATKCLVDAGHRRIAVLTGTENHQSSTDRFWGYRAALEQGGIAYDESLARAGFFTYDGGYAAMKDLVGKKAGMTAVFAMNDASALGARKAAEESGLGVPGDISVIGYDGYDIETRMGARPELTTMKVPLEDMGRLAVKRLCELVQGDFREPVRTVLPVTLLERATVRKI